MSDLKKVVITGGAKGIGFATANLFSQKNYCVIVIDNDIEALQKAKNKNSKIEYYYCDISDIKKFEKCVEQIKEKFSNIDILINNAGIQIEKSFDNYDYNSWNNVMNTNYFGVCNSIFLFGKIMSSEGTILNILSVHSNKPRKNKYAYDSSKSAIEILTKELALEYAPKNITINALSFGAVDTPMNSNWIHDEKIKNEVLEKVPLKIIFEASQIADFIYKIITSFSKYTTGSIFTIDGGRSLV